MASRLRSAVRAIRAEMVAEGRLKPCANCQIRGTRPDRDFCRWCAAPVRCVNGHIVDGTNVYAPTGACLRCQRN